MKQTEIAAKVAKFANDARKAQLTLELDFDSWGAIPELAKMVGTDAQVVLYPSADGFDPYGDE